MDRIDEIRERLNAATPGPWKSERSETNGFPYVSPVADTWGTPEDEANADLIAAAPDDLRDLLEVAKAAKDLHDALSRTVLMSGRRTGKSALHDAHKSCAVALAALDGEA